MTLLVVYASKTGNVKRFVNKLGEDIRKIDINEIDGRVQEPYILISYTTGFGQVPNEVEDFLEDEVNQKNLVAVASSGNRNWGDSFALSADKISEKYGVPVLLKFELSGLKGDVNRFVERVRELDEVY